MRRYKDMKEKEEKKGSKEIYMKGFGMRRIRRVREMC
jgi:hypothetical protein